MSSIAYEGYRTTKEAIKEMARQKLFRAAGNDTLRGVAPEAVVGRFAARQDPNNEGDQGENNLLLPGIVISHVRHTRPPTGGEFDYDDGIIQQLVQIVDRINDKDDESIESYLKWQEDIRETLQTNPYRNVTHPFGNIYYVQVSEQVAPGNETFVMRQAKLVLQVNLYTRTRINRETLQHGN
jgi:hypothetical protein